MSLLKSYTFSSLLSLLAKSSSIIAQLALLFVANKLLGKDAFGLFILAQTIVMTVMMTTSSPFFGLMLYRITKFDNPKESTEAQDIAGTFFWLSALAGLTVLGLLILLSPAIAALAQKPTLTPWLIFLGLSIPFDVTRITLAHWHRANGDIKTLSNYQETFPSIIRMVLLAIIFMVSFFGFNHAMAALCLSYIAGSIIPLIPLYKRTPFKIQFSSQYLGKKDIHQGLHGISAWMATEPSRSLDVILVGLLTSASMTADYAVAARIARLLLLPKLMFSQLAVPRLGRLFASDHKNALHKEYALIQYIPFVLALAGLICLFPLGGFILSLFGDYQSALPVLLLLGFSNLIATGFGTASGFLGVIGEAEKALHGGLCGLALMLIAGPLLTHFYGGNGMAFAFIIANLASYSYYAYKLKQAHHVPFLPQAILWNLLLTFAVLILFLLGFINIYVSTATLVMALLATLYLDRQWLTFWVQQCK